MMKGGPGARIEMAVPQVGVALVRHKSFDPSLLTLLAHAHKQVRGYAIPGGM